MRDKVTKGNNIKLNVEIPREASKKREFVLALCKLADAVSVVAELVEASNHGPMSASSLRTAERHANDMATDFIEQYAPKPVDVSAAPKEPKVTEAMTLNVRCPQCGVREGVACRNDHGRTLKQSHVERRQQAIAQQERDEAIERFDAALPPKEVSVECPLCGAEPGVKCFDVRPNRNPMTRAKSHQARLFKYEQTHEPEPTWDGVLYLRKEPDSRLGQLYRADPKHPECEVVVLHLLSSLNEERLDAYCDLETIRMLARMHGILEIEVREITKQEIEDETDEGDC